MRKLFVLSVSALAIASCATPPNKIPAQYVSPMVYKDYDCDQILVEQVRIERRTGELYSSLKQQADGDRWQTGLGILFWPAFLALEGGDGPEATEYARLRGEYNALNDVGLAKKCGIEFEDDLSEVIKNKDAPSADSD